MSRRPPLPRDPIETAVDGFTHGGEGVARIEGKAVFVPGALPGERIRVQVVDDRANWARAQLLEVLEPSPDRVEPPCPYVPACGGCDLQHAHPDAQRRLKTRVVVEQLQRIARIEAPAVADCVPVGPDVGYRTTARFHAGEDGALGFHRWASNDVVPIDRCLVLTEAAQQVRDDVGDGTGAHQVQVRAHEATGSAAAVLVPGPGPLHPPDGAFDLLLEQPDGSTVAMRGDGLLSEVVAGLEFTFPATSFFQVSPGAAEALVAATLEAVGDVEGAVTWDLYSGVGLLSLPLARAGADVLAVEADRDAAAAASANAERAGLGLRVLAEPVHAVTRRAVRGAPDLEPPEIIVLDPPRTGAGTRVMDDLVRLEPPNVVYVACDVAALARDARTLVEGGYDLVQARPFDLFPMTHHVEVVASFVKR